MLNGRNRVILLSAVLLVLFLALGFWGYQQTSESSHAILQGSIDAIPAKPILDSDEKIQPGTPVKLSLTIENKGTVTSSPGEVFVRYAYAKPLEEQPRSILFTTEKKPFPAIPAGEKVTLFFDKEHELPSLLDFIRYDWSMREYQAIVEVEKQEKTIGTLAITFSAYYYPGIKKEFPTEFPVSKVTTSVGS